MEKCSVPRSLCYQSYPGQASYSYTSLQNVVNRLHEKQKVGSRLVVGSPFFDGMVTLQAGPTFLYIKTLALSAGSIRSRQTIRACVSAVGNFFLI